MSLIWLTGFSGAGKTTIATNLKLILDCNWGLQTPILDGDAMRAALGGKIPHGPDGQRQNIATIVELAKGHLCSSSIVIGAFVSPIRRLREKVKEQIQSDGFQFVEVHVQAKIETCRRRDVKGLYQQLSKGESIFLAGINVDYEPPLNPAVTCNTDEENIVESTQKIVDFLIKNVEIRTASDGI